MPIVTAFAAFLLSAQPAAAPGQAALAQCLAGFVAAQPQAADVADVVSAMANACHAEERAYREAYVAAAAARGTRFVAADSDAAHHILDLRTAARDAYLSARPACAPARRRR